MTIPRISIKRLCQVVRLLEQLMEAGREIVFSDEIGSRTGIPSYQVRKDISYLGEIGTPGRGYNVRELYDHIAGTLGLKNKRKTVLVGVGRLGSALLQYVNISKGNFEYCAAFDNDPQKIGTTENGIPVYGMEEVSSFCRENSIEMGVVTVPRDVAQDVVDKLVEGGVTGILNFAPIAVMVPEGVVRRCIDLSLEMKILTAMKLVEGPSALDECPEGNC